MSLALQAQPFTREQCVAGLRAAVGILEKWQASSDQACRILRISRSTYTRARQRDAAWSVSLDAAHQLCAEHPRHAAHGVR